MGPQALRMNLNTLLRHGVFGPVAQTGWTVGRAIAEVLGFSLAPVKENMVDCVAARLADAEEIRRSRQFPSSDSDVDLRGCHLPPLRDVVGLDMPNQTLEHKTVHDGTEVELVSHEVGKYLRLLVRNNGYILEQVFSPIVVMGQEFLDELRPRACRCITRRHYHHYRGF